MEAELVVVVCGHLVGMGQQGVICPWLDSLPSFDFY